MAYHLLGPADVLKDLWLWLELKFISRLEACLGLSYVEPQPSVRVGKAVTCEQFDLKSLVVK